MVTGDFRRCLGRVRRRRDGGGRCSRTLTTGRGICSARGRRIASGCGRRVNGISDRCRRLFSRGTIRGLVGRHRITRGVTGLNLASDKLGHARRATMRLSCTGGGNGCDLTGRRTLSRLSLDLTGTMDRLSIGGTRSSRDVGSA